MKIVEVIVDGLDLQKQKEIQLTEKIGRVTMSTALRDENLETQKKLTEIRKDTEAVVLEMKNYYGDTARKSKGDVIRQAKEDKKNIQAYLTEYEDASATVSITSGALRAQGKNSVAKLEKFGKPAAVQFIALGAMIGGAFEYQKELLRNHLNIGKTTAAVVGFIVAGFCSACVAFLVYFGMMKWAQRKEKLWKETENKDQQGSGFASLFDPKRTCLSEIRNLLGDLEEGNFDSTINQLKIQINNYLEDN